MTHIRATVINVTTTGLGTEQAAATITGVETIVSFTQQMKSFCIYNTGANTVYFSEATGVAITNFPILAGASLSMDLPIVNLYFICAVGLTTTLNIIGIR